MISAVQLPNKGLETRYVNSKRSDCEEDFDEVFDVNVNEFPETSKEQLETEAAEPGTGSLGSLPGL